MSRLVAGAILALSVPAASAASTVAFTTPLLYAFGDCTPGCTPQFQQVYSASMFAGPVTITGIRFELNTGDSSQTYTFRLSTSTNPVGSLSPVFASNVGADVQTFYTGIIPTPDGFNKVNFIGTPFNYDPGNGDLLLEITHPTATSGSNATYIGAYSSALQSVSRVYSFSPTGDGYDPTGQNVGLMTWFTIAGGVPEPANWALLIAGFGLVGAMQRRRRAVAA